MANNFNAAHGARALPTLQQGDTVRVKTYPAQRWSEPASVSKQIGPRSYIVERNGSYLRRNRQHLMSVPMFQKRSAVGVVPVDEPRHTAPGTQRDSQLQHGARRRSAPVTRAPLQRSTSDDDVTSHQPTPSPTQGQRPKAKPTPTSSPTQDQRPKTKPTPTSSSAQDSPTAPANQSAVQCPLGEPYELPDMEPTRAVAFSPRVLRSGRRH